MLTTGPCHCQGLLPAKTARQQSPSASNPLQTSLAAHSSTTLRASSLASRAVRDAGLGLTEPSKEPLAVFKRWLQTTFPLLRNEELLARAAWTIMISAVARLGLHLKLPYVDRSMSPTSTPLGKWLQLLLLLQFRTHLVSKEEGTRQRLAACARTH